MAEKKTVTTFDSVMRELKAGKYRPVYLLMGDESYFIDRVADYIADNVLAEEEKFFNQSVVFGADVTPTQVMELAREYPVMPATHRVVVVKEAQSMKQIEKLERYLDKPVPTTLLVICYKNGSIDKRKKIVSKADAVGVMLESKKKKDSELPGFIEGYLKLHKATANPKAAAMIAEHVGADLNRLVSELDKVLISLPENDRVVTPEIVERQIGVSKDFNAFELRNAIVQKNVFKANQIVNYFNKNPKAGSLYSVVPLIFSFFQNLMVAYYAPDRNSDRGIAMHLDLKSPWAARDYLTGMRNYTATKTLQIISKIREIDAKSKGLDNPNTPPEELIKELLFFILH